MLEALVRRATCILGLGLLVAGAVLHRPLAAQVRDTTKKRDTTIAVPVPARADSLLRDSLAKKRDTTVKPDTIKAPLAHAEEPASLGIGRLLHWTRDSLFATGALTVADLLERVPGMTTYRAGWLGAPMAGAYLGNFHRLRVFYDGFEMPELDPRNSGVLDLTQVNLWSAEDVVVEQTAEEVRVYLRSWRVRGTTPVTRTDVATGDQQSNLYRGFYGRRLDNGGAIQFAAQQLGTTPPTLFGTAGDNLGLTGRIGWAKPWWSVDAFLMRFGRHRGDVFGDRGVDTIPALQSTRTDAYLRVAVGDPDTSLVWAQAMAVAQRYDYTGVRRTNLPIPKTPRDSVLSFASLDTGVSRAQYILTAGTARGPIHLSATERLFGGGGGKLISAPSIRGSLAAYGLAVSAFAEAQGIDSISRSDITAQLSPVSFVSLLAGVGQTTDGRDKNNKVTTGYGRAEAGLRVANLWLIGGVLRRGSVDLGPPRLFDTSFLSRSEGTATGMTAAVRGQLWRLLRVDASAIKWNDSLGFYRPRYQTRSELSLRTNLIERFPTNNFGLLFSVVHEYRSGVRFPVATGGVFDAPGYRTISTLLEIRILNATASWQFRNVLGERYSQVPFFIAPRQTNFYGVRWEFTN